AQLPGLRADRAAGELDGLGGHRHDVVVPLHPWALGNHFRHVAGDLLPTDLRLPRPLDRAAEGVSHDLVAVADPVDGNTGAVSRAHQLGLGCDRFGDVWPIDAPFAAERDDQLVAI